MVFKAFEEGIPKLCPSICQQNTVSTDIKKASTLD